MKKATKKDYKITVKILNSIKGLLFFKQAVDPVKGSVKIIQAIKTITELPVLKIYLLGSEDKQDVI